MRVRFTATAHAEIADIVSYIAEQNPAAAADLLNEVERTIAMIAERPRLAPVVYRGGVRARMVGSYQYRVFYVVKGDDLIVRNVRSTRRLRPWERE
jgi:plasmid stabilization system protein ParE